MSAFDDDLLAETNVCGRQLLRLVSRGSSILAELLRLCEYIPAAVVPDGNPSNKRYAPILFDLRFIKTPEMFEKQLNTSPELTELDNEFYATHEEVIGRFHTLFESVFRYITDFNTFVKELSEGYFVHQTVEGVLLNTDGKQLLCEALYLLGLMYLLMDMRIPGPIRERLLIAHYRHKGDSDAAPIVELARLVRDTGYRHVPTGSGTAELKRPAGYPEEYFARFPVDPKIVNMIITRLRSDDVYKLTRVFPAPEHRSCALAQQASILYVVLYFSPKTLQEAKPIMREIVDKHFSDNWVVPVYMGVLADLTVEWERYRAAKEALSIDALQPKHVASLIAYHRDCLITSDRELARYLTEGVLTEAFVLDSLNAIMDCLRVANTSLRWVLLHRKTEHKKFRDAIMAPTAFASSKIILDFMLRTSMLELKLKAHIKHLLNLKEERWAERRGDTASMMDEMAEYFSGTRALTRVERNEDLMGWFERLGSQVRELDYHDVVLAGRKIRKLIDALTEVQKFDVINSSPNTKEFLERARTNLNDMVRTVNVTEMLSSDVDIISDLSFAWELLRDYVVDMHERIRVDPRAVGLMRALFLKLKSVLDIPLLRISQSGSRDAESVAQHYSNELVKFLRTVLSVVPEIVFNVLSGIIALQTQKMKAMPIKFEFSHLRDYAQIEDRHELARRTYQIAEFTDGVLAMKKTLLGIIEVDPRKILEDGIRKHMVDTLSVTLYNCLVFDTRVGRGRDPKANMETALTVLRTRLDGFKKSFEYVQDYIGIYGLKMWQEEFTRIVAFNTEQECNKYLVRQVLPDASKYQSTAIPIPLLLKTPAGDTSNAITFMGRLVDALVNLTDPRRTIYGPGCLGGIWFEMTGREIAGLGTFRLLLAAVGVPGMVGLDRLLGFMVERELTRTLKLYAGELRAGAGSVLHKIAEDLEPTTSATGEVVKVHHTFSKKLAKPFDVMTELLLNVGHAQLLRRAVGHELRFACRLESNLLCGALESLNSALVNDIRKHYYDKDAHPMPEADSPLLPAVAASCEAAGIMDALTTVYTTTEAQPCIGLWLALLTIGLMPRLAFDHDFGSLIRKKPTDAIDGSPLVVGIVTLLKQLHPSVTQDWMSYMGQYIRSSIVTTAGAAKPVPIAPEAGCALLFLQHACRVMQVPDRVVHAHVPAYLFDGLPL